MPIFKKNHKIVNVDKFVALTAKNLSYLMDKKKIDVATLCAATKLAIPTVNSLRRGIGNPTLSTLLELANFFEVSLGELTEQNLSNEKNKHSSARSIPLIKINEINRFLENKLEKIETYTTEIDESSGTSCFAVLVNNDSLYPQFSPGTVLIVSRDEKPLDSDIVLVKIKEHNSCFRKIFINGDHFLFSSVSIENDATLFSYDNYELIGVLLKAIKTISGR